jgi:hypothetical protein
MVVYLLFLIFLNSYFAHYFYFLFLVSISDEIPRGHGRPPPGRQIAKIAIERDRALRAQWFNRSPKSIRRGCGLGLQPGAGNAAWNSTSCLKSAIKG